MRKANLLQGVPSELQNNYEFEFPCGSNDTWWDIIRRMEYIFVLVYQNEQQTFVRPAATHPLDAPDLAGYRTNPQRVALARREVVVLRFRFARGDAAISMDDIGGGGNYVDFTAPVPAGVQERWEISSFTSGGLDRTVFAFAGMAGALPGGDFRATGRLEIQSERSYFKGVRDPGNENANGQLVTTEREVVPAGSSLPVHVDGPRRKWLRVFQFSNVSGDLRQSFRGMGLNVGTGAETLALWMRVD